MYKRQLIDEYRITNESGQKIANRILSKLLDTPQKEPHKPEREAYSAELPIPPETVSVIIGKGGCNIKPFNKVFNVICYIDKPRSDNPVAIIEGSDQENVRKATRELQIKVQEIEEAKNRRRATSPDSRTRPNRW